MSTDPYVQPELNRLMDLGGGRTKELRYCTVDDLDDAVAELERKIEMEESA